MLLMILQTYNTVLINTNLYNHLSAISARRETSTGQKRSVGFLVYPLIPVHRSGLGALLASYVCISKVCGVPHIFLDTRISKCSKGFIGSLRICKVGTYTPSTFRYTGTYRYIGIFRYMRNPQTCSGPWTPQYLPKLHVNGMYRCVRTSALL